MKISRGVDHKSILRSIYEQILELKIDFPFKPLSEFDSKWYRVGNNGPFILFPHPSIDDPLDAINGCEYPNVWISYDEEHNKLGFGLAFWSVPSVDQRFVSLASNRNEKQKDRALKILKHLPDDWQFYVYKRKRFGTDDVAYQSACNKIDSTELLKIISSILEWRVEWKKETSDPGSWITPAVNFMRGLADPDDSDQRIIDLFEAFDQILNMLPSKIIKAESNKKRAELQDKILNLQKNLVNSKFKESIELRIALLKKELDSI
jgi:hypothetical protein